MEGVEGRGLPSVTCPVPTEFKKFLLYARQMEIRGVDLDAPYYNYIISFTVPDIDNVTVLDYDAREQRVYWSDVRTQAIKRAFINGTGVETGVPRRRDRLPIPVFLGFPDGSDGKESTCNAGDPGSIPGSGRSPGEGNGIPLQYSCLENPMDRGAWP